MKKAFIFILVAVIVLAFTPTLLYADPAAKATGGVVLSYGTSTDYRHATFNAQEENGDKPAKGVFTWIQIKTDGTFIQHKVAIDDVTVTGNEAWFSGIAKSTVTARDGDRLFIYVKDDGTPGNDGDVFALHWDDQPSFYYYDITEGNLVVH